MMLIQIASGVIDYKLASENTCRQTNVKWEDIDHWFY